MEINYPSGPIILMGVSGCGKTTVGKLLSSILRLPFYDADDFHPRANKEKMAQGIPLNDADREPWLKELAQQINKTNGALVLACSALKESYRTILDPNQEANWIVLNADYDIISARLSNRQGHFFDPALLQSQFETLELPEYGIHMQVDQPAAMIAALIAVQLDPEGFSDFGLIGLGVMGSNLALNLIDKQVKLSVYNRFTEEEAQVVSDFLADKAAGQVLGFTQIKAFVKSIRKPRNILLMVPAGKAIDAVIDQIIPFLDKGDSLIDGGNANYKRTDERELQLSEHGIAWMGCGVSGGRKGARLGPSMMLGGNPQTAEQVLPILNRIAARDKYDRACVAYMGSGGAGHFVKMVHNGMEYAEMQLLAEVYDLLRPGMEYPQIAELFEDWNKGGSYSYLLEISAKILGHKSDNGYELDRILDVAGAKGTGAWSAISSLELGTPSNLMSTAVFARSISSFWQKRQAMAQARGKALAWDQVSLQTLKSAYDFVRLVNHIQGFQLIMEACRQYKWTADLAEIARIWTAGCIIKSKLMEDCQHWLSQNKDLLEHQQVVDQLNAARDGVISISQMGLSQLTPLSTVNNALNWWLAMTQADSPAKLIQAQRDYFGQHGYARLADPDQQVNHNWEN